MTTVEVRYYKKPRGEWKVEIDGSAAFTERTKEYAIARSIAVAHDNSPATLTVYQTNGQADDGFPVTLRSLVPVPPPPVPVPDPDPDPVPVPVPVPDPVPDPPPLPDPVPDPDPATPPTDLTVADVRIVPASAALAGGENMLWTFESLNAAGEVVPTPDALAAAAYWDSSDRAKLYMPDNREPGAAGYMQARGAVQGDVYLQGHGFGLRKAAVSVVDLTSSPPPTPVPPPPAPAPAPSPAGDVLTGTVLDMAAAVALGAPYKAYLARLVPAMDAAWTAIGVGWDASLHAAYSWDAQPPPSGNGYTSTNYYDRAFICYLLWRMTGDQKYADQFVAHARTAVELYYAPKGAGGLRTYALQQPHNWAHRGMELFAGAYPSAEYGVAAREVVLRQAAWFGDEVTGWLKPAPTETGVYMNLWEGRICGRIGHTFLAAMRLDPVNEAKWLGKIRRWGAVTKTQQDLTPTGEFRGPDTADGLFASVSPFMSAERSSALLAAHRATGDAVFLDMARADMDWIAAHLWSDSAGSFRYRDKVSATGGTNFAPDVNGLIAPVYAELHQLTGDAKYRDLARKILDGATRFAFVAPTNTGAQKQLNQYARGIEAIGRLEG